MAEQAFNPVEWITSKEAAEITTYTDANIRKALRNGRLNGIKRAGVWFVLRSEVIEYAERMQKLGVAKHDPRLHGNWPVKQ